MYLLVLSENLKTSLCSKTTAFPGFAGTFSFGARLTPLNLALLDKNLTTKADALRKYNSSVGSAATFGMIQQERQNNIINILGGHSYAM